MEKNRIRKTLTKNTENKKIKVLVVHGIKNLSKDKQRRGILI